MTDLKRTFRPHERMNDPGDFRRAFERKRSASDSFLVVHGAENGLDHSRLGISIAKKRIRKAVDRNRVKRLIREAFRLNKHELPFGIDYVVVPRGGVGELTFEVAGNSFPQLAKAVARRLGNGRISTQGRR